MDFNLKQWRERQNESEEEQSAKKQLLESPHQNQHQQVAALPLFVSAELSQPTTTHLSSHPDHSSSAIPPTASTPRFSRVGGRCFFSITQWQELEVQALIYRHMVAGASIPPELLQLVKKSLFNSSTAPYYLHNYSSYFQPPFAAACYWGKGAMDPEPGRCRRTDGKKWRCSKDVVAGHKYCERHMHRGRNRSRKHVEFPATDTLVASLHKPSYNTTCASGPVRADTQFSLSRSGASSSLDAFQFNPGSSENETLCGPQLESSSASRDGGKSNNNRVLMHLFDDYPRPDNTDGDMASSTSLSISTRGNSSSDFLRLSTGNDDEVGPPRSGNGNGNENDDRERGQQLSWNDGGWGANPVGSMGGPLAEALRSSSNSSPTTAASATSLLCT